MSHPFFDYVVGQYGLYAIFFLAMIEGDITLLLAGVLAHSGFFGDWGFIKVICAGTLGGAAGDQVAYAAGSTFSSTVRNIRFYRAARPRIERLTTMFGARSIFLSKYIYGLRTASCIFFGVGGLRYRRFLPLSLASCFVWVLLLGGSGYFFSGAINRLLGDFRQLGRLLLVIVAAGVLAFYLAERFWLSKKVETVDPERIHELEAAAQEKLHEIGQELRHNLPHQMRRREKPPSDGEQSRVSTPLRGKPGRPDFE